MKKLLTLLSLTMAMTAFGAPQGNVETSHQMNINARVITPLTVNVTDMNFGNIIQNSNATANGTYTITGEPNQGIIFTLDKPEFLLSKGDSENLGIHLTHDDLPTSVDPSGTTTINITGTLSPNSTHSGDYEGTIIGKIQYN